MSQEATGAHPLEMPGDIYEAYKRDFQMGILTVGNVCSANCFFCSQKWNPPGVIRDLRRFLTLKEIEHFSSLHPSKIAMIASAHHTNSGEFFLHPDAVEILDFMADTDKLSPNAEIFTNGMNLTEAHVRAIKKLNLNLYISLNSADVEIRKKMMGGTLEKNKHAIEVTRLLDEYDVDYYAWIVPLKSTLENGDTEKTIRYLDKTRVKSIQIHRPGYTKLAPAHIAEDLTIPDKTLLEFSLSMREKYQVHINVVILSPQLKCQHIFNRLAALFRNVSDLPAKKKLFLCSKSVENELPLVLKSMKIENYDLHLVPSKVFGGNIDCSGLILVEDYLDAIEAFLVQEKNGEPEVLILPGGSFDINLEDLSMAPAQKIQDRFGIPFILA